MITIGGMIGLGKTTVAELLAEEFGSKVFYESVDDNPILPLFYTLSEEELLEKRLPFLLQLHFLHTRAEGVREAKTNRFNVIDRSLAEDEYFARVNHDLGRISDLELQMYKQLKDTIMFDLDELPYPKKPDLMVYLTASFETVMNRIQLRGRDFEQDQALYDYYHKLWSGYDEWIYKHYKDSDIVVIDMDKIDVVSNEQDARYVVEQVKNKLKVLSLPSCG